jgi:hypothetical protein
MIVASLEKFMNHENVDSRRMELHRRIALISQEGTRVGPRLG